MNEYKGSLDSKEININHFDLYRLKSADELSTIGFDNYITDNSICLIEWPQIADDYLNIKLKSVNFEYGIKECNNENERVINW